PPQSIITLQGAASPLTTNAVAGKTTAAPIIDGQPDSMWSGRSSYAISHLLFGSTSGSSDSSGTFKLAWDNSKLYLLADITDDSWHDPSTFGVAKMVADNSPPHVLSATLDFATNPQRIKVAFDENVFASLSDGDLQLVDLANGAPPILGSFTGYDTATNTAF